MLWDQIPQELKINGLWCCWKLDAKGKIPFDAKTGKMAKSNDKTTFHPFMTAIGALHKYQGYNADGRPTGGLGLGIFNGFSAIDIDNCIDENGNLSDMAQDIVDYVASYTEFSPSGKGIRVIFKTNTDLDKSRYYINNRDQGLEIYISDNTNKFVTITGDTLHSAMIATVDISYILDKYMRKDTMTMPTTRKVTNIDRYITKDAKLNTLWNSRASGSGGNESETDLALCNKLAFYLNGDYEAINDAFMSSPYYATKDDDHRKKWEVRNDYREQTIKTAIQSLPRDTGKKTDDFELNDTGNAHLFANRYGHNVRYNHDNKSWMIWNGQYWQHDMYMNVKNMAEVIVEEMKQSAFLMDDYDKQRAVLKNVQRVYNSAGKEAMLKEAQHLSGIPCTNDSFDKDDMILTTKSGVIDLRDGSIKSHDKHAMLSKFVPYEVSHKPPKRWLKFLDEIFQGDQELIGYMQKVFGYSMTGSNKEQVMFILLGDGANGKSLLLEIVNQAMGSYGSSTSVDILLDKKTQSANMGDVARLAGIRHVITEEPKLGDRLNESALKTLTSGIGRIVARFLYGNEFEFTPKFKIFMATNYKPIIRGTDNGIWRRIHLIPFNRVFDEHERDKELIDKLMLEMPEILGWMIDGCIKWQQDGGLTPPASVQTELKEYRAEMDIVQRWMDESCEFDEAYRTKSSELFDDFNAYVSANKEYQMSANLFGRNLSKKYKKMKSGGTHYYVGIRLKQHSVQTTMKKPRNWGDI
jgi:putative DNA primase/helicase